MHSLKELSEIQPIYFLPQDDLLGQVVIPCLQIANTYECMTGFFTSSSIKEMAPGFASFLQTKDAKLRLLTSPYLTPEDQLAIKSGIEDVPSILARHLEDLLGSVEISSSALAKHTLECLAYLISTNRIEIKLVLVKDGLFHPKIRIFSDGNDIIAVHGSNNLTKSGFTTNVEQIIVSKSWAGGDETKIVNRLRAEFDAYWTGKNNSYSAVYDIPTALKAGIIKEYLREKPPSTDDFKKAWNVENNGDSPKQTNSDFESKSLKFFIPEGLIFDQGDFEHQGRAINAWLSADRLGILEMATGSGKTIASLVSAFKLFQETCNLLLVIAVPYLPLVHQWEVETKKFGLDPLVPGEANNKQSKLAMVGKAVRSLKIKASSIECLIVTHDYLCDINFQNEISKYLGPSMLIADEVHDLGTNRFLNNPPVAFKYRLGLSATPIRQYDPEGTAGLNEYFGKVIFRFTLKEAIGRCLVPYNYYVHLVELDSFEQEEWVALSAKLKTLGWQFSEETDSTNPALQILLNRRRRLLEQASGKIESFREVINQMDRSGLKHLLVYASDKGRGQLNEVNRMIMNEFKLRCHQITDEETGKKGLSEELLTNFADGNIQVLTAMRVLDEGVDIPEVTTAIILASTTVERQWVQRRGRVLRKCKRIHKELAYIHDFLVLPSLSGSAASSADVLKIIKSELGRVTEFAKLAKNAADPDGALATIRPIIKRYF